MQIRSRYTPRETALLRISDMCIRYFFPKRLYLGRLVCVLNVCGPYKVNLCLAKVFSYFGYLINSCKVP